MRKKKNMFRRIGAIFMSLCLAVMMAVPAFAATESTATVDTEKPVSLSLYKYDMTSAADSGAWDVSSYVSTGIYDNDVNTSLSQYAVQGVEFSYIKLADLSIYKGESRDGQQEVIPLYAFTENTATNSRETVDFLSVLGLTTDDAYRTGHDPRQNRVWYFESDPLINALEAALEENATSTKTVLESYLAANGGTALPETDENGKTGAENLEQGLYLIVETRVPENITSTTAPFLVSLPMTTIDGSEWNYDVVLYPKNETGSPNLEKTVREAKADTGKHEGTTTDISDGYAHTATASDGDVVEYQIISTLPTITSPATALTTYTFVDQLSEGIKYNKGDVKIEFFKDAQCTDPIVSWTEADGKFCTEYTDYDPESGSQMTIETTESGLSEINTSETVYDPAVSLQRGYSACTLRITYACAVNSSAAVVYGNSGNPNEVTLTWKRSNTNYSDTLKDCCHVYTYGLDLTKKFSDGAGNYGNVKFLLKNSTDNYYVKAERNEAEGIYYVTGHTESESEATQFSPMSNTGRVIVKGLEDDSYTITEIATDNGYKLLKEDISVEIAASEGSEVCALCGASLLSAAATVNGSTVEMNEDNASVHAIVPLTVTNSKGYDLPKTGGNGSSLFYIVGGFVMIAALAVIALGLRRHRKNAG